jgi:hypothetical protein
MNLELGVAYFDARAARHTVPDLDDMAAIGTSYVVHTFSEFDQRWQPDSVKRLVQETTDRGMDSWIDPWGVGEVFGGEPFSRFGALHPEARQVGSDGIIRPAACLNQTAFREFLHGWIDDAARLGGSTIFWDEPTWWVRDRGAIWSCRCATCQGRFRERFGAPMPAEYTAEVQRFLQESMADLLSDACLYARHLGLRNAVCVMPWEWSNPGFTDWELAASIKGLDIFGSDPYPGTEHDPHDYVTRWTGRIVETATRHGLDHHVWVQAFEVPRGGEGAIRVALDAAVAAGAQNIAVWSYDGCAAMSTCECGDPSAAWEVVRDAFRRARGNAAAAGG